MELMFKCPIINLLTFFILNFLKFVKYHTDHYDQSNYFLYFQYSTYLKLLKPALEVIMLSLNSESRLIHSTGLYKTKNYSN